MLLLSLTDIPFHAYYKLASTDDVLSKDPNVIVILSGSGMPSPEGLIRTYYGAEAAKQFSDARVIIATPFNEGADSLIQIQIIEKELLLKGILPHRIEYEPFGYNTYSQAKNIGMRYDTNKNAISLLIVTSPEHMYRSIRTFQKVGFSDVGSLAAFEIPIDAIKLENSKEKRSVGLLLRYNMWSYLNYEILVLREYVAITYYKLKGWI